MDIETPTTPPHERPTSGTGGHWERRVWRVERLPLSESAGEAITLVVIADDSIPCGVVHTTELVEEHGWAVRVSPWISPFALEAMHPTLAGAVASVLGEGAGRN
jgi:hypothetical protein